MSRRPPSRLRTSAIVAPIAVLVALSCGAVSEEELSCEEAVSRLQTCCPKIDPRRLDCEDQNGCNSGTAGLPFDRRAAQCIRDTSCEALVTSGKCETLARLSFEVYPLVSELRAEACR